MTTVKEYIGDAVYAEHDSADGTITLTTENGIETTNEIFLEPEVYNRLLGFVASVRRTLSRERARRELLRIGENES